MDGQHGDRSVGGPGRCQCYKLPDLDILTDQSVSALCSTKETLPAMEESLQWDPATEGEDTATELCRAS